jgi:hypothetical protein
MMENEHEWTDEDLSDAKAHWIPVSRFEEMVRYLTEFFAVPYDVQQRFAEHMKSNPDVNPMDAWRDFQR